MTMDHIEVVRLLFIPSGLISFVITCMLGVFIYRQNRHNPLNRFFAIFALSVGCWSVGSSLENLIQNETAALRALRLCYVSASFLPTFFLHFSIVLTNRRSKYTLRLAYLASTIFAGLTFLPLFVQTLRRIEPYAFRISEPGPVYGAFVVFFSVCMTAGLWWIYLRLREVEGNERRQLRYILLSHLIAVTAGAEYFTRVFRLIPFPPVDDYILVIYFLVFAYAILRHQLFDIRVAIQRSLVYSLLIACLTALYLVMILVMERWFQGFFGYRSLVATIIVAFMIAVGFNPLRHWLQAFVDRALWRATPPELAAQREQLLIEVRRSDQQKAVATLAAGLAHEIKNPLAAIKTFTDYLPEKHTDPAFIKTFHRIVSQELTKIYTIVQNLLTFAKPAPLRRDEIPLTALAQDTAALLQGDCLKTRVTVEVDVPEGLSIHGDQTQMKQVLLNLCLNSLEAMEGIGGRLRISAAAEGEQISLTVQDTGKGIKGKDLAQIFDPFFTTKATGTGLGLCVVQGIVQEHSGRIRVESCPGQGTMVKLVLPRYVS